MISVNLKRLEFLILKGVLKIEEEFVLVSDYAISFEVHKAQVLSILYGIDVAVYGALKSMPHINTKAYLSMIGGFQELI